MRSIPYIIYNAPGRMRTAEGKAKETCGADEVLEASVFLSEEW